MEKWLRREIEALTKKVQQNKLQLLAIQDQAEKVTNDYKICQGALQAIQEALAEFLRDQQGGQDVA